MDQKVGDSFWSAHEGEEKQTNKANFKPLGNLTLSALLLKIQLLIKVIAIKSKICFPQSATTFQSVGGKYPTTPLVSMQCIFIEITAKYAVDFGDLKLVLDGIGCGDGVGV